jgi:pimeloyl-ACP methyl ester carboxylesterase
MKTVDSADGTEIAYDSYGSGPALIISGGAFNTRFSQLGVVPLLTDHFTVITYDRRGRGDSGNTPPYAIEREVDDLEALIYVAGGMAFVAGHSSGAIIGLETAARSTNITKLVAYEPPFVPGSDGSAVRAAVADGDLERAALGFFAASGIDAAGIQQQPFWPAMVAIADTLPHDFALVGTGEVPRERYSAITAPTLLVNGGNSEPWAGEATAALAGAIPGSRRLTAEGQDHNVADDVFASLLVEFFVP